VHGEQKEVLAHVEMINNVMPTNIELVPKLEKTPGDPPTYSVGIAETFSWVPIENNAERPLYARATYVTNMSDMSVNLEASNITIPGGVTLADGEDLDIKATVVDLGVGLGGALRVITQDLESNEDSITIGDIDGNKAEVNSSIKALKVTPIQTCGNFTSLNNFDNSWTLDGTKRPVLSFKKATGNSIKLLNYLIKGHNATGVIGYEWWNGNITITSGPAAPSWSTVGNISYRVYQDMANSNTGNTASTGSATLKHSGIITNYETELFPPTGNGVTDDSIWTLFLKRLDSNAEHEVYFTLTFDEY